MAEKSMGCGPVEPVHGRLDARRVEGQDEPVVPLEEGLTKTIDYFRRVL